jgi:hypothetical protein
MREESAGYLWLFRRHLCPLAVAHEHLYWDQATVFSQLGVLDHPVAAAGVGSTAQLLKLSVSPTGGESAHAWASDS